MNQICALWDHLMKLGADPLAPRSSVAVRRISQTLTTTCTTSDELHKNSHSITNSLLYKRNRFTLGACRSEFGQPFLVHPPPPLQSSELRTPHLSPNHKFTINM